MREHDNYIIDAHCHLGATPTFYFPDISLAGVLRAMDRLQIEKAVSAHTLFLIYHDFEGGLSASRKAFHDSGGRILNYVAYNPNHHEVSLEACRRGLEEEGFVGIKIHPASHGCAADDERYRPVWELAQERKTVLMSHTWSKSATNPAQNVSVPPLFEKYLKTYPDVKFIFGHAGGRYRSHLETAQLVARYDNAFLDIAGDSFSLDLVEWFVARVGAHKFLYASDFTWCDPAAQLGMVLGANVADQDKLKILRENAVRVFDL